MLYAQRLSSTNIQLDLLLLLLQLVYSLCFVDWDLAVCLHYEAQRKQLRKPPELDSWIDLRATYRVCRHTGKQTLSLDPLHCDFSLLRQFFSLSMSPKKGGKVKSKHLVSVKLCFL